MQAFANEVYTVYKILHEKTGPQNIPEDACGRAPFTC